MSDIKNTNYIVKVFQNNDISILNEDNKYYFRASDVATILEISHIYRSIQNFTNKERVVQKCHTLGVIN